MALGFEVEPQEAKQGIVVVRKGQLSLDFIFHLTPDTIRIVLPLYQHHLTAYIADIFVLCQT